jgi:16S rRNA (guanine(527)-N(7))-methyltransferase RsmG
VRLDGLDNRHRKALTPQFPEDSLLRPGRTALEAILENCGLEIGAAQINQLWSYHQLLRAANPRLNLTRIHNFENMVLKHYVDSLLVLRFLDLPTPLIDMGSGAGLPGIPLAIARPEVHFILAEPRGARAEFLTETSSRLGLQNVEVYAHKLGPDYPGHVAGIISRAVAEIPDTLGRVAACLRPGGRMIFMKGPECDQEITEAEHQLAQVFRLEADHAYSIPGTPHRRRLVVYQRLEAEPPTRSGRSSPELAYRGPLREVSSESNPSFRLFRDLLSGRGVRKHGQALIAGPRIIAEVQARFPDRILGWISGPAGPDPMGESLPWYRLSTPLFKELDIAGTGAPLVLVSVPPLPSWSDADPWPMGCTLFVPFQDPENVGAVIRSAAAFGVARLVLLREAAHPFHPRSTRAAGTAVFQVPLYHGPSIKDLESMQVPMIALDTSGPELSATPFPPKFGLVVGVEGPGLTEHLRQGERRRIAIAPEVESLNAATAAAIALHAWARQREGGA